MTETLKEKVEVAAHKVAETARSVGAKVVEGTEWAVGYVKEKTGMGCIGRDKGLYGIMEHMDVIAGNGKKIGVVDELEDGLIKMTRNDSPDGRHHYIPTNWVERVDNHVHLYVYSYEVEDNWKHDDETIAG